MDTLRKIKLLSVLLALTALSAWGQQRYSCIHFGAETRGGDDYILPAPPVFERGKVYRQPVVLITFSDTDFSMDDPAKFYDRLFNEKGFNQGVGPGCVADYFRDQSNGLANFQFDIYGPYKVSSKAGGHGRNYYPVDEMYDATAQLRAQVDTNFNIYDWDGDGLVNQVLFVLAGYCGNKVYGYTFPATGHFGFQLPGGLYANMGSFSCELWHDNSLCGLGTIIHEFCHCLGLPDIYPLGGSSLFSVLDDWDLMDGGNYTNKGWCPPNLTAMEKFYFGWKQPTELTSATSITGLKPVSQGGEAYLVRNSGHDNEYYLLENRQQEGWDYACPGNGLVIYHVNYDYASWRNSEVNFNNYFRFNLFHADNKDYLVWDPKNDGKDFGKYTMDNWVRSRYLSTSPYPYTNPETQLVNDLLTDESTPASTVFYKNAEGAMFMSKAITNIRVADDGTISFDFMKGTSGIQPIIEVTDTDNRWYDLQGRQLQGEPRHKGVYIHNRKKVAR